MFCFYEYSLHVEIVIIFFTMTARAGTKLLEEKIRIIAYTVVPTASHPLQLKPLASGVSATHPLPPTAICRPGRKNSSTPGSDRKGAFLFQRVSLPVQYFNADLSRRQFSGPRLRGSIICTEFVPHLLRLFISVSGADSMGHGGTCPLTFTNGWARGHRR